MYFLEDFVPYLGVHLQKLQNENWEISALTTQRQDCQTGTCLETNDRFPRSLREREVIIYTVVMATFALLKVCG